jgi:hypothetical protein
VVFGGIYAVLGSRWAGAAVALSYLIAGVITFLTTYSYYIERRPFETEENGDR